MKKFLPFLALILLVGLIAISTYNLNKKQSAESDLTKVDEVEDFSIHFKKESILLPDFSLPSLYDESKNFSKKNLLNKYSLVNFFASWCTTCRAEHKILLRLHDEKIIAMYGIAWRDIDENTKEYLEKNGNPYDFVATDSGGLFNKIINIEAVPETLLIDDKGNVALRYKGNLQEFAVDEIRRFVKNQ
jgi:cytochrome c biogenesis protein CcmG/thiol:disulfide interchange protein DsbE